MSIDGAEHGEGQDGDAAAGWVVARYQATPPKQQGVGDPVGDRVEEGAPRADAVPEALATAPSSTSGTAARTSSSRPARRAPLPMATAAPAAMSTPSSGEVVGGDAGRAEVRADRAQAALDAASASVRRTCGSSERGAC